MNDTAITLATPDGARVAARLARASSSRGTLVFLHGLASNLTRWSEFVAHTRLAAGHDLLRIDLRGHGGSRWRGRIGHDIWADDIARLLAQERLGPAILVGHCMGANLALHFAMRHAALARGLVLVEPMFRRALEGRLARVARLRGLLPPTALVLRAAARLGLHRREIPALDLEVLDRHTRAAMARHGPGYLEALYASPLEDLKTCATVVYLQGLYAVTAPAPPLERIAAPALALLSTGGAFGNPAIAREELARLPRCRVETLDAVHWIPTEQPLALREAVEGWVAALPG